MRLNDIDSIVTEVANCIPVELERKRKVRDDLFNLVMFACHHYECDELFKKQVKAWLLIHASGSDTNE